MKIRLNGKKRNVQNARLSDLIAELGYREAFVGVALNGEVVAKSRHRDTDVLEGDHIEIVAPLQGG